MNTVTISSKFQLVIPKEIRERVGIAVGDRYQVINYGQRLELVPLRPIRELRGVLAGHDLCDYRDDDRE